MERLNLGCGKDYKKGYTNADISDEVGADIVFDMSFGIPFKNNMFDEVLANNCLTQIAESKTFVFVINELWRVCKPEGFIQIRVPNAKDICA